MSGEEKENATDHSVKTVTSNDEDDDSVETPKEANQAKSLSDLQDFLNQEEECLKSSVRSRGRAEKELQELSDQGATADQEEIDSCRKDLDRLKAEIELHTT